MKLKYPLVAALIACWSMLAVADGDAEQEAITASEAAPAQPLTPQILYQFLLAEIAAGRGQLPVAAAAYLDLAKSTRDPRIAQRASEIAYHARQPQLSLDAARIWSETDTKSAQAKHAYWSLLARLGRAEELANVLGQEVATETDRERRGAILMQIGRLLSRLEDKKMANRIADRLTEPYLDLAEAHFVRAQSAYGIDDKARAATELDQAVALKPDWEAAAILKAQLFAATPQASLEALAAFIKKYPEGRDARLAYARALIESKRYDEARSEFDTLLKQEPNRPDLLYSLGLLSLQLGEEERAEGYLKSLLDNDFPEMGSVHFYLGQIAEGSGRSQEAIEQYDAIAPGSQHHVQGQVRAAATQARVGQLPQAIERLRAAQAANPGERNSLLAAEAQLLNDNGRTPEAYQLLADALQQNPDDTLLLYESALYAERLGKMEVLERNLRKVIKLKPDYAHAYNALGYSLADRNQRLDEADALISKALAMAPGDAAVLDSKGWVNYRRGDLPGAAEFLQKALEIRADPEIAAHLGEVLWQMGRREEAGKAWDDALKLDPHNEVLNRTIKRLRR